MQLLRVKSLLNRVGGRFFFNLNANSTSINCGWAPYFYLEVNCNCVMLLWGRGGAIFTTPSGLLQKYHLNQSESNTSRDVS